LGVFPGKAFLSFGLHALKFSPLMHGKYFLMVT